ncbi:MAG TPA: PEP/pyruvate-binding domain-containing protein [Polyangiaceae bacterium]|jgi:pyruvate,water dikinase|nr:PEP/pyruvate-binding domain-containing protein [Polyangiaceae bacterium]
MSAVPLSQADDPQRFGGKAHGLARALNAGLPVPPGLAVAHDVLRAVVDDQRSLLEFAEQIAQLLPGPVAVRSSAVGEDAGDASFAGQHLTRLNAEGAGAIAEALAQVWQSGHRDSARAYRERLGLGREVQMGVVVQQLVPAEVAGVMFTRNPLTRADERVIEAARGLGEVVVQGLITPDYYRVARNGETLEVRRGNQDLLIRPLAQGGTEELECEPPSSALLDQRWLEVLNRLATDVESAFAGALDIEWALAGEAVFLLQVRSLTA